MLGAVPPVIESPSKREPRVLLGPSQTCTFLTAPPTIQSIADDGEHIISQGSLSNFQTVIGWKVCSHLELNVTSIYF